MMVRKIALPTLFFFLATIATQTLAQAGPDGPRVTVTAATQKTQIINALSSYITHLTAQPEFTSVASVLETALPSSVINDLNTRDGPLRGVLPTATDALQTASWYQALPSDVKSYFASAASEEAVIARESGSAAAPGRNLLGGLAGVVGAAGVVGMMVV